MGDTPTTTGRIVSWAAKTARESAWAPIAIFSIHAIAAMGFDAYDRFPPLDIPMHFLGGVVIAYFFHRAALNASTGGLAAPFHPATHVALVFGLTCTAALFWEFAEFLSDRIAGTHAQLDLDDTLLDMLLGALGGATFLVIAGIRGRIKPA